MGLLAAVAVSIALVYPTAARWSAARRTAARVAALEHAPAGELAVDPAALALDLRAQHLGPLLASWETVAGCGAGGSGAGGGTVKWIGRNVHGGLFNVTQTIGYLHLKDDPNGADFHSGYNLLSNTQISGDFSEKWNAGVIIPYSYKVYNYYKSNTALDTHNNIANGGLGDVSVLLVRKFGEINDTIATLTVGLPTGKHNETDPGGAPIMPGVQNGGGTLSQEKQLGFGRPNATLAVDHVFDEVWGLVVSGGTVSYRGGTNDLQSYRAPSASLYTHVGYFMGPFVPAAGLTVTGFSDHDKDVNSTQDTPKLTVAPSASVEWTSDYVAVILGGQLPFGGGYMKQTSPQALPWAVSLGLAISPF